MKYMFLGAAAFMMLAPSIAQARDLTDASYLSASRCVAYAQLPQLSGDGVDVSTLSADIAAYNTVPIIESRARGLARDARLAGRRAGDDPRDVATLRDRRDDACAGFVATGMIQAGATPPAS